MNGRELYLIIFKKQRKTITLGKYFVLLEVKFGGGIKGNIEEPRKLVG